jgi:hypothetical protein
MAALETLKKMAEKATGLSRPAREHIEGLVYARKANVFKFKDSSGYAWACTQLTKRQSSNNTFAI